MLLQGHCRVGVYREMSNGSAAKQSFTVSLYPQTPTSPAVHVSFVPDGDYVVQAFMRPPSSVVMYFCPREAQRDFMAAFPMDSEVSVRVNHDPAGADTIDLIRIGDSGPPLSTASSAVEALTHPKPAKSAATLKSIDLPGRMEGVWSLPDGRNYEFRANGNYLVHDTSPFALENAGATLNWGGILYDRLAGDTAKLEGWWISTAEQEDVLLRDDGTYVIHDLQSGGDAIGEFLEEQGQITTKELRAVVTAADGVAEFDAVFSGTFSASYAFSNNDNTLTLNFGGQILVYLRAP